jgi:ABC-type phosphate transport system substrate-binding protein
MSAFKQKLAKVGATAGVLASATAMMLAVGGVSASSALALKGHCEGEGIHGEGSSLQRAAQETWNSGFNTSAKGCNVAGKKPAVTYTVTSSGTALKEWGVGSGALGTNGKLDTFISSDDAPKGKVTEATSQLGEIRKALRKSTTTENSTNVVTIPVTQTSVAIVVNLPANCTLTQISTANLEAAFEGSSKTWSSIGGSGTGCTKEFTRVVRSDASGTTYQFKHYLQVAKELHGGGTVCTTEYGNTSWTFLQNESVSGSFTPNLVWPDCSGTIKPLTASGGGALVAKVSATDSSIGYAALPDAESSNKGAEATILEVEDGEVKGAAKFANPFSGTAANCSEVKYNLPLNESGTAVSGWEQAGTATNVDWSEVYGSSPTIGGGLYPLCTLTFSVAATNSTAVWGESKATTLIDYLKYLTNKEAGGGQEALLTKWYAKLPNSTLATSSNPQLAAEKAVAQIG